MLQRVALAAAVLLMIATPASAAQTQTISLQALHHEREHGTATITQSGPNLVVAIAVRDMPHPGAPEFAHIHQGTCSHLGAPTKYELEPIRDGRSTTTLKNVSLSAFAGEPYSIAVHQTLAHVSMHVACGGPIAAK